MTRNLQSRVEKLEARSVAANRQARIHVVLMEDGESAHAAVRRYERELGRTTDESYAPVITVEFV